MVKKLITDAAENGFKGFYYLYQPVLEMKTGRLHCCEATLFWGNEDMTVPRSRFLPIIDQLGYSRQLYRFACDKICSFCASVREQGYPEFRVSFKMPENILNSEISVDVLQSTLLEYSLPPSCDKHFRHRGGRHPHQRRYLPPGALAHGNEHHR